MKKFLMALLLLASVAHGVNYRNSLPDGRYLGEGNWSDNDGVEGRYLSYASIQANELHTDYVWSDGQASINVSFWFNGQGWFSVVHQGNVIGDGFCMEHQCQYNMNVGNAVYTETFSFDDEHFHKIGHRREGTHVTRWEDTLFKLGATSGVPAPPSTPADTETGNSVPAGPIR